MTFLALSTQAILTVLGAVAALLAIRTARTPQGAVGWVVFLVDHVRQRGVICLVAWRHDQAASVEIERRGSGSAWSMRSKASTIM